LWLIVRPAQKNVKGFKPLEATTEFIRWLNKPGQSVGRTGGGLNGRRRAGDG